ESFGTGNRSAHGGSGRTVGSASDHHSAEFLRRYLGPDVTVHTTTPHGAGSGRIDSGSGGGQDGSGARHEQGSRFPRPPASQAWPGHGNGSALCASSPDAGSYNDVSPSATALSAARRTMAPSGLAALSVAAATLASAVTAASGYCGSAQPAGTANGEGSAASVQEWRQGSRGDGEIS
ncbi:unnamed protein product, partial [Phaeothamnion confervicola]